MASYPPQQPGPNAPAPPQPGWPQQQTPPPPAKSKRTLIVVAAVVVVVVILVVAVLAYEGGKSSTSNSGVTVTVTQVEWSASGCGFGSTTAAGYTVSGGASERLTVTMQYPGVLGFGTCTVNSVSVQTAGFQLVSQNTPFTITAGNTGSLVVTVGSPTVAYDGPLVISVSAS